MYLRQRIDAVSFLPLFVSCVRGVFNSPVAAPAHGLHRFSLESSTTIYIWERELACFVYLCQHPRAGPTSLSC